MVSRVANPSNGDVVLLFGPQALSFDREPFLKLRKTILESPAFQWVLDVVDELPSIWNSLSDSIPRVKVIDGENELIKLKEWIRSGDIHDHYFPLPKILLSPLVVITQLTQYANYVQEHAQVLKSDNTQTLGFCTGILSALAVSSSNDDLQFAKYGSVAVRLAMVIGAIVDAQDAPNERGSSKSLATVWNTTSGEDDLNRLLAQFSDVGITHLPILIHSFLTQIGIHFGEL